VGRESEIDGKRNQSRRGVRVRIPREVPLGKARKMAPLTPDLTR